MNSLDQRPTLCLCMIVKDEVDVLPPTFESCRHLINYWVIADTGSTDGTQDLIRRELADIPGELHERPWVDFGHNRSEVLELARGKADYLLLLDADCTLDAQPEDLAGLTADSYLVRYGEGVDYYRPTLVSGAREWRFIGAVHEYIHCDEPITRQRLEHVSVRTRSIGAMRKGRWERDAGLLEADHERDPANPRTVFYLGQTYRDLGHLQGNREMLSKAAHWYRTRAEMEGWIEEKYWAWHQYGQLNKELGDWPAAADAYTRAWELRPARLEAALALVVGLREQRLHQAAHRIAGVAAAMEPLTMPADLLFVEPWVYQWGMLFEYSITAYWVGQLDVSLAACRRLLKIPDLPEGHRKQTVANMRFAVEGLARKAAATPPPAPRRLRLPGTPTRGLRGPDALTPLELRVAGLANRLASVCGMSVTDVDRFLLGLGGSRTVDVPALAPWPIRVRPGTTDVAAIDAICNGDRHLPLHPLEEAELIMDLGAHIGLATLHLAKLYPTARFVAVEMDEASLALCAENIAPLRNRVTLVGAAVAATDGMARYSTAGDPGHHALSESGEQQATAISLDTLFEHTANDAIVDYMKMSIEGGEEEVLAAGGGWPQSVRSINVAGHGSYGAGGLLEDLRRLGFVEITESSNGAHVLGTRSDAQEWRGGVFARIARRGR
jgi:FkbM family methyltransferase